jgi:hypothetical protein
MDQWNATAIASRSAAVVEYLDKQVPQTSPMPLYGLSVLCWMFVIWAYRAPLNRFYSMLTGKPSSWTEPVQQIVPAPEDILPAEPGGPAAAAVVPPPADEPLDQLVDKILLAVGAVIGCCVAMLSESHARDSLLLIVPLLLLRWAMCCCCCGCPSRRVGRRIPPSLLILPTPVNAVSKTRRISAFAINIALHYLLELLTTGVMMSAFQDLASKESNGKEWPCIGEEECAEWGSELARGWIEGRASKETVIWVRTLMWAIALAVAAAFLLTPLIYRLHGLTAVYCHERASLGRFLAFMFISASHSYMTIVDLVLLCVNKPTFSEWLLELSWVKL